MSYTLNFVADFGSLTGLTLNAKLYDDTGAQTGATITTGFVEIGNGAYSYKHTTLPDGHRGSFVMYKVSDVTIKVVFSVNPEEAENTDAKTSTRSTLTAQQVWDALTSALTTAGSIGKYIVDNLASVTGVWNHTANEPSSVPASNATMAAKLGWLFTLSRNRIIQTSMEQSVYADDGVTLISRSSQGADNTQYIRGEFQ